MKYHNSLKLFDNIFCYIWNGMGNNCNTVVLTDALTGDKRHIIIDPGHITNEFNEPCFESLEKTMASDKININNIGLIINTHSHPDHCEANDLIVNKSRAMVAMSKEEDEFRNSVGKELFRLFGLKFPGFSTGLFLKEGDFDLHNAAFKIRIILCPGHSPGSICLFLPNNRVLITGDVIFFMSIGRTDFPGGDINLLKNSIQKLAKLEVDYLIPGHNTDPQGIIKGRERVKQNFEAVQMFF